jgi:hypothetical protein
VGVSQYPKLGPKQQLKFTERDAQAISTILISPEGGNFKAENVHVLSGAKATLAGLRREIDQWLPSVAKDDDRVLIYIRLRRAGVSGAVRHRPGQYQGHRIADARAGRCSGEPDPRALEDAAHRRLPQRRHQPGRDAEPE